MTAYLLTALLLAQIPEDVGGMITEPVHPAATQVHSNDDVIRSYGGAVGTEDYWCEHDTAATPDEFACWTTDADSGGGTDGKWMSIPDGGDDVVYSGGATWGDDLDVADNDILNPSVIYQEMVATDAAADNLLVMGGAANNRAAVNTGGAPIYISGGVGAANATCVFADAPGTILTFVACDPTGCTTTSMTEGTHWNRDTDNDLTCTALETYVDGLGLRFASTCVANVLWLDPAYTTNHISLTSADGVGGGTKFAIVDGVEGPVLFQAGTSAYPSVGWAADNDGSGSGMYRVAADQIGFASNGSQRFGIATSNTYLAGAPLNANGQRIHDSTDALTIGNAYGGTDYGQATGAAEFGMDAGGISQACEGTAHFGALASFYADSAQVSAKGAKTTETLNVESVTFPGGAGAASAVTVGSLIPDGAILDGITTRVTTADNGGACTGYTVGDGADIDLYGVAATETLGTTTTPTSGTASIANPQFSGPFEVTITGTGGNCIDMVVAITAHYRLLTAATSN